MGWVKARSFWGCQQPLRAYTVSLKRADDACMNELYLSIRRAVALADDHRLQSRTSSTVVAARQWAAEVSAAQ